MNKFYTATVRQLTVTLLLSLGCSAAWSLGAGNLQLQSRLGEPFRGTITLTDTGDLSPEQIVVRLAPRAMFEKMDVERSSSVLSLQFAVDDQKVVTVKSRDSINEPFVNFILEVYWPQGRIFREYRVLLDPVM